jgi:pyridinium-3,5-bisthiocarboxylic acid mononucleotide nickel chelatase
MMDSPPLPRLCWGNWTAWFKFMRIAYIECFSGISGDMFLGALVDAGVPADLLRDTVRALNLGAELQVAKVDRCGITSTKVDVVINGEPDRPREAAQPAHHVHSHEHGHSHGHEHAHPDGTTHTHSHAHDDEHHQDHPHAEAPAHGRHLSEIKEIIAASTISAKAKQTATAIFGALGQAEAKIHNVPVETIHFHEVGAVDAIVDIMCAAVGAEALQVDRFIVSPLNVGGGTVVCAHGTFPVPAPATVELLKGAPVFSGEIQKELVTPTGAAIVKVLADAFGPMPAITIDQAGYGAGSRNFPAHANVLRITVGESAAMPESKRDLPMDGVVVLEANIDDLNPQLFGYLSEQALAAGALDVFATPVQMKKGRPGTLLTLLTEPVDAERIARIVFRETTTIGIRTRREQRYVLPRRHEAVQTQWGEVRMKIAQLNGTVSNYAPEYEDCRRIAEQHGVPLKTVMQEAIRLYLEIHPNVGSPSHTNV